MKKLYFLFFLFLPAYAATAQKIHFTDRQNKWVVAEPNLAEPYYYINVTTYDKDTVSNGHTYVHSQWGWFREDTVAGIVYYKKELQLPEKVLYDYNMKPGDSLVHTLVQQSNYSDSVFYLHSVDSIMINGAYHLVQFFANRSHPNSISMSNTVIEGIGQIAQFPFLVYFHVDGFIPLSCFRIDDRPIYVPKIGNWYSIDSRSCTLGVADKSSLQDKVTIVPHPANSSSIISFPSAVNGRMSIINAMGQTVMENELKATTKAAIGTLPASGIYFYRVIGAEGIIASGKVVYE